MEKNRSSIITFITGLLSSCVLFTFRITLMVFEEMKSKKKPQKNEDFKEDERSKLINGLYQ